MMPTISDSSGFKIEYGLDAGLVNFYVKFQAKALETSRSATFIGPSV